MKKKRAIISGGCGFIGSHLTEFLFKKNYEILVIDNLSSGKIQNINKQIFKRIKFYKKSLKDLSFLKKIIKDGDTIFHVAALADIVSSVANPGKYFHSNVVGTFNLLEACRGKKIKKFIYTASSSCYGIPKNFPTKETEIINNKYPYAFTKYFGEQLCMHWMQVYKLPVISLRLFNVYGPRARTKGTYGAMFGVFLAQFINKKPLTVVGDGKQKRDFIFVSDIVQAIYCSSKSKKITGIFNISTSKSHKVISIAKKISTNLVFIPKRPGEPDKTQGDNTKFIKKFKWKPKINIHDGIKKILKEKHSFMKAPIWTPKKIKKVTSDWFKYLS